MSYLGFPGVGYEFNEGKRGKAACANNTFHSKS